MKILHLISGLGTGGAEHTLYKLVTGDKKNNHIIISLTTLGYYGKKLKKKNFEVYTINLNKNFITNFFKIIKLYFLSKKIKANFIQSWMYHADFIGLLIAFFLKVKIFWNIRNSNLEKKWSNKFTLLLLKVNAFLSRYTYKIISCSQKAIEFHISKGYEKNKLILIDNGFSEEEYFFDQELAVKFKNRNNLKKTDLTLGMIARWHAQKNHELLFKVLQKFAECNQDYNIKLLLAGSNINNSNKDLINLLNVYKVLDKTILLGEIENTREIYCSCDFTILPSIGNEGFPNVVAESLLCETPVIATNSGDVDKLIISKEMIVECGNFIQLYQTLANSVNIMLNFQTKWQNLRINSRNHVKNNFGVSRMIKNYNDVWLLQQ